MSKTYVDPRHKGMVNQALLVSTVVCGLVTGLVAAGCSGGNSAEGGTAGAGSAQAQDDAGASGHPTAFDAATGDNAAAGGDHLAPTADASTQTTGARDTGVGEAALTESGPSETGAGDTGQGDASGAGALAGWKLTWSDEFNGPDGSAVDPTKWKHDVGGSGWGNNELEYYTDGTQNAVVQGGYLVITATKQGASQYHCSYGTCQYTSARLLTEGLFSQQYGRFEARVQMPTGKGIWPAVWMMGDDISTVGWPKCGEIDFMETIGTDISTNHGSLHMPGDNPSGTFKLPNGATFADAFHTFSIEWEPGTIRFYVDDQLYETQLRSSVPAGGTWEFEQPFFLLVNVAVGGSWPGSPDSTTVFPQTMKVDWVRVYQKDTTEP
jgi:beta-glucanase (GH16 family)